MLGKCLNVSSKKFDIYIEEALKYRKYFENPIALGRKVKEIVLNIIREARVYIFGSVVRGKYTASSDIDILVVTPEKLGNEKIASLKAAIYTQIDAPIEIHVASEEEYRKWYRKFISEKEIVEVP